MLSNTFGLPTASELTQVIREWQPDPAAYIGASILPERGMSTNEFTYERTRRTGGMTKAHNLDADPKFITGADFERYTASPYYFKEGRRFNESDLLTIRRQIGLNGDLGERAGRDLIVAALAQLDNRLEVRREWLRWSALQGAVTINEEGVVISETWSVQTYNADTTTVAGTSGDYWTTLTTSNPVADFAAVRLLGRNSGVTFSGAKAYMNQVTANLLFNNTLLRTYVREALRMDTLVSMTSMLEVFSNLSGIFPVVYDQGYINSSDTWVPFIPDNRVVVVGRSAQGEELGFMASTPSLHNGGIDGAQAGKFVVVDDQTGEGFANPKYDVFAGWYGGPIIQQPGQIVVMSVGA